MFYGQSAARSRAAARGGSAALRGGVAPEPAVDPAAEPNQAQALALAPFSPQIARGTAQQFSLRDLRTDGHDRELTHRASWRVTAEDGRVLPAPKGGLVQFEEPGRYQVTVEYLGRKVETPVVVTTAAVRSLSISPTAPQVAKGLTQPFKARATFTDGSSQDVTATATWSVKDLSGSSVALISSTGLASARNVGKARITARYTTFSATATLTVTAAALQTLTLSPSSPSIAKGTSQRFVATGTFSDGTVQDVSALADWAVKDLTGSGVASIDGSGTAVGDGVGTAKVSAAYLGITAETVLTVSAAAVASLTVTPSSPAIPKGTTQPFKAVARFTDGSSQDVSAAGAWTAHDVLGSGVASIDAKGLASGNAVGNATIVFSYRGYTAVASLYVNDPALVTLTLTPASATVSRGLAQMFKAVGSYSDGSTQDLTILSTWTATDLMGTDVASVGTGTALGKNVGQAQIKAEYQGKSATATLTVSSATLTTLAIAPRDLSLPVGRCKRSPRWAPSATDRAAT